MTIRRSVRVLFTLLTAAALLLAFQPGPNEQDPGAATGGLLVFAASFGLIALFTTWRGLLLGIAALCLGLVFVPPAPDDPDPVGSSAVGLVIAAVLISIALWQSVAKLVRRASGIPSA